MDRHNSAQTGGLRFPGTHTGKSGAAWYYEKHHLLGSPIPYTAFFFFFDHVDDAMLRSGYLSVRKTQWKSNGLGKAQHSLILGVTTQLSQTSRCWL